mmetsp:Transcript_112581/g.223806  ORF Transcript_112581/g.223806 Transcript_112581/m.223806 type:complete len:88 (-) Transcript_112581:120-383(-)
MAAKRLASKIEVAAALTAPVGHSLAARSENAAEASADGGLKVQTESVVGVAAGERRTAVQEVGIKVTAPEADITDLQESEIVVIMGD